MVGLFSYPNGDLMTDTTDTPVGDETPNGPQPTTPRPLDDAPESEWKAYARKWEDIAKGKALNAVDADELKNLRDKAKRLQEIEDASKSEQQKLSEAAEQARQEATETAAELAKLRAAVKHGLSDDDLDLLGTGTAEEIEARAERLAARLKGTAPVTPPSPSSDGQGRQGEPVSAGVRQLTRDEFNRLSAEQKLEARERGQLANLLEQ